jgi:hypothetical protein
VQLAKADVTVGILLSSCLQSLPNSPGTPGAKGFSAWLAKTLLPAGAQLPEGRTSTSTLHCSALPGGSPVMLTWHPKSDIVQQLTV